MSTKKIGFVCIAAPFFESSYAENNYSDTVRSLRNVASGIGIEIVTPTDTVQQEEQLDSAIALLSGAGIDGLILQMGTFNTGVMPVRLCRRFQSVPTALWAIKEPDLSEKVPINSLCGVNLISNTLHSLGHVYRFFYSAFGEAEVLSDLEQFMVAARTIARLRELRIGHLGGKAIGFFPCLFDELRLQRYFGIEVITVGLNAVDSFKVADRDLDIDKLDSKEFPTIGGGYLDGASVAAHERTFQTLKKMVESYGFDALTIRDWPELTNDKELGAVWPAIGRLHDEVLITGVEGDMLGTVTMLIQELLSDRKPFLTDLVHFDFDRNTVVMWHYGAAPSLARDKGEIRYGCDNSDVEFTLRPGVVTIARLREKDDGYQMLISRGTVLDERVTIERAGAVLELEVPAQDFLNTLIYDGWPHHVHTIEGDYVDTIRNMCHLLKIDVELLV